MKYFRLIIIGLIITNITAKKLKKRQWDNYYSEEPEIFNDEIKEEEPKTFISTIKNETMGIFRKYNRNSEKWEPFEFVKNSESNIGPDEISERTKQQNIDMPDKMVIGKRVNGWGRISGPQECARQCVTGEQPKICYFDWTANYYSTLSGACALCVPKTNSSIVNDCECIYGDGYNISGMTTINRMYPGPSIQVCLGDLVVVDLTNNMDGSEMTIHWHGIYQRNYQFYDGVPLITQCPIKSRTTFRYQWVAQNIGTHWWHSHTGLQQAKLLNGMIVIREPKENDPNNKLYDRDDVDNHIFLGDWMHVLPDQHFPGAFGPPVVGQRADNILINGQGQWLDPATGKFTTTPLTTINVKPGLRYRFRMVNSGNWDCPMQLTIQNHDLTIIASDGDNVRPRVVNTITLFPAERYDFILNANQRPGVFWIQVRLIGFCFDQEIIQWGILRYSVPGLSSQPSLARPTYNNPLSTGIIFNNINEVCNGMNPTAVCVKNLESADPVDPRILADKTDYQFFLPFTFYSYDRNMLFRAGTADPFLNPGGGPAGVVPLVNGISNVLPTSPLLTQARNIPESQICNGNRKPSHCLNNPVCQCTHVIRVPLDASVEIIMYDDDRTANLSHPFHLHGYGFHVMAQGSQNDVKLTSQNIHRALQLDQQRYKFNSRPPVKDVLAVPPNGYTIVRFIADNPGYWFYHCHILPHLLTGMSLTFHVGTESDLPLTPEHFPTCGNFKPPVSFHYN